MPNIKNLLIIANSVRMLAYFASRAGYKPLVIDCFSDLDTQNFGLVCIKVKSLALKNIIDAIAELNNNYTVSHIIYGSGFERYCDSLKFLQQNYTVLGNSLTVFKNIQNKTYFFSTLSNFQIPYPPVSFIPPNTQEDWLLKPLYGEGGVGITRVTDPAEASTNCYWQKYKSGLALSVLFLANGSGFKIYGFNRQQVVSINDNEFVFSAIISQLEIDSVIKKTLTSWLDKLVKAFALKGINSLDFIVDGKQCYILEVNARPSASMQLFDHNLLAEHIESMVSGHLGFEPVRNSYQAYQVIYAEKQLTIKTQFLWPHWVLDIPATEGLIYIGMPICSIIASGKNEQQVMKLLLSRKQQLIKLLYRTL